MTLRHRPPFHSDTCGAAAVEFALIAPVLLLFLFGIICFGVFFGTANAVEQLAAEAARASVAGLTDVERGQIVNSYIAAHVTDYNMVDPKRLTVSTASAQSSYTVALSYDMSNTVAFQIGTVLTHMNPQFVRSAAIQNGGY